VVGDGFVGVTLVVLGSGVVRWLGVGAVLSLGVVTVGLLEVGVGAGPGEDPQPDKVAAKATPTTVAKTEGIL